MSDFASPLSSGSDSRRNWRSINKNSLAGRALRADVQSQRGFLFDASSPYGRELFPFEVYRRPNSERGEGTDLDETADWWRTFLVRHGYLNGVSCAQCDDTDEEGTLPEEIIAPLPVLPATEAFYFIWVEADFDYAGAVSACDLSHGAGTRDEGTGEWTIPNWTGYPLQKNGRFCRLLARIKVTATEATIRQFQIGDIHLDGGSFWLP